MPVSELARMRQQMEEEIRAQLMANQEMLNDNEANWDEKVRRVTSYQVTRWITVFSVLSTICILSGHTMIVPLVDQCHDNAGAESVS